MKPGRIVMLVLGTLAALAGLGLLTAPARGLGKLPAARQRVFHNTHGTLRRGLPRHHLGRHERHGGQGTAVRSSRRQRRQDPASRNVASGKDLFIGIGPQADVAKYLTDVRHSELTAVDFTPFRATYLEMPGTKVPGKPADQTFWSASAQGPGTQQIEWDLRPGTWSIVVMNADAGTPVAVDLQAGVRSDLLLPVFVGLLIGGVALLVIGVPLIVAGAAGLGRHGPPPHYPAG
ncbi:hypothetical protein AHiyo6_22340, partial [Arthrobacter sp. Hiyo6]